MRHILPLLAAASLLTACVASQEPDEGQISLSLIGTSSSGATYRLRHADLSVTSATTNLVFHTEEHLTEQVIRARMPVGPYTLSLAPGWNLERIGADGSAQDVVATLATANPLPFNVVGGEFTPVRLEFNTSGDVVDLDEGDIGISIGIHDTPDAAVQGIVIEPAALTVTEGASATFSLRLAAPIISPVTVVVTSNVPGINLGLAITFSETSWNVPLPITVAAAADSDLVGSTGTISLQSDAAPTVLLPVTTVDPDVQSLVVTPASLVVPEGATRPLEVSLRYQPTEPTTVTVSSTDPLHVAATPATLTFTATNYATPQVVTVAALADSDSEDTEANVVVHGPLLNAHVNVVVDDTTEPVTFGFPAFAGQLTTMLVNNVHAVPFDVTGSNATISSLGIIANGPGTARLAVYDSTTAGIPRNLVTEVFSVSLAPSPSQSTVFIGARVLTPGRYWLAVDTRAPIGAGAAPTTTKCLRVIATNGPFPTGPGWECGTQFNGVLRGPLNLFATGVR